MSSERLQRLKQRRLELAAQIQREESRLQQQARKDDTRRKVLWGAMLLELMDADEALAATMKTRLDRFLYKDYDRELFDFLPPRTDGAQTHSETDPSPVPVPPLNGQGAHDLAKPTVRLSGGVFDGSSPAQTLGRQHLSPDQGKA